MYPFVLYTIRIRRRPLFYFTNIVGNKSNRIQYSTVEMIILCFLVPCFLISSMTILGFLLAPESSEKLTLRKFRLDQLEISFNIINL